MEGAVEKVLGASPLSAALFVAALLAVGAVLSVRVVNQVLAARLGAREVAITEPVRRLIDARVAPVAAAAREVKADITEVGRKLDATSGSLSEALQRLAAVEANQGSFTAWLTRIEAKLDRVLER